MAVAHQHELVQAWYCPVALFPLLSGDGWQAGGAGGEGPTKLREDLPANTRDVYAVHTMCVCVILQS